jgi:hypothetical protein
MLSKKSIISAVIIALMIWIPLKGQDPEEQEALSPKKAKNYGFISTFAPIAVGTIMVLADSDGESGIGGIGAILFWAGGTFGPGTGYLYAHHPWGFWRGVLIRTAGVGAVIAAMAVSWDDPDAAGGWELFIGGSILYLGSGLFDIVNSGKSAENYNKKQGLTLKLKPCYIASEKAAGLMLSVGF